MKRFFFFLALAPLLFPVGVRAITTPPPAAESVNVSGATAAAAAEASLPDPLGVTDVRVLVGRLIKAILGISGMLALLMFVWGGLVWMTSQGEKEKIAKGQKTLAWAVIGLAVLFTAYAGVNWVVGALTETTGG
ncbi:hypothetical protein HYW18_00515 [Candidatus Uhrbacteria bacterium]|nr:hypothetical protein [Candidatus Uhrbacteria bacterium]